MSITLKANVMKQTVCSKKDSSRSWSNLIVTISISLVVVTIFLLFRIWSSRADSLSRNTRLSLDLSLIPDVVLEDDSELARARNPNCSYWDCFNVYKCGQRDQERIAIYVYPLKNYADTSGQSAFVLTREFYFILQAIVESPYYTPNPNEACIFIPSIDILNQNKVDTNLVGKILASLPL